MLIVPETEPADGHLHVAVEEALCQVERPGKLVRLHADEHHHSVAGFLDRQPRAVPGAGASSFRRRMDLDLDIFAEHVPLFAIEGQAVERRERPDGIVERATAGSHSRRHRSATA
jgi:hypothetical protein